MADKDKIASIVTRRYKKMKELNGDVYERVQINRNLYNSKLNVDDNYEWDYSLTDPYVFPIMRNYLSRSGPQNTGISLGARTPADMEKKQINQSFVNWEVGELMATSLFYRIYFSGYLAGHGYAEDGWLYEPTIKIKTPTGEEKILRNIVNRADAKFVRFNDVLIPNRNIPVIYDQPYYCQLKQMTIGEMEDYNETLGKEYFDKEWIKKLRDSGVEGQVLDYQMEYVKEDEKEELAIRAALVSMVCMHTKDNEVYYVPLKGEEKVVNKMTENPYWHGHYPILDFCPFPEDDEYYSMGIVDVVGDLQIAATENLNQSMTNIRQVNNDMWVAGSDAAATPDWAFQKRPSGIIRVAGDADQVQQIRTQDNTMSALRFGQDLQARIERVSGISSLYASGAPSQGINQTARGAQIIEASVDTNLKMLVELFGEQVVKKMGEHFLELNAQYVTEEQTFFVTGKKGVRELVTLDPSVVSSNFDVYVNTETMLKQTPASRQASLQNLMTQLTNVKIQNPDVQIDLVPVIEAAIDAYPEMESEDEIVVTIDEKAKRDIAMLERGQEVEVKVKDPHAELMQVTKIHYEDNANNYTPEVQALFGKYFIDHQRYLQSAQEVKIMSQPTLPQPGPINFNGTEPTGSTDPNQMGTPNPTYNLGNIGVPGQGV